MPWFNLCREAGGLVGSGSSRILPELLSWQLVGQRKSLVLLSASRAGGGRELTWAGPHWENTGIGRFGAASRVLPMLPWFPSGSKTAQVQPCPLSSARAAQHPSLFYHTMSVWGPQKRAGGWMFLGWMFLGWLFFPSECFCYLAVPCETSHAAPTAAELLFFTTSPSPGDGR